MKQPEDILIRSSKKLCLEAAQCASESEEFLDNLIDLSLKNTKPFSHRSSWAILYLGQKHPNVIRPHLRKIVSRLPELESHTQVGSFLRLFDVVKFDHEEFGELLDFCIHVMRMPAEREYVKVIALNIMLRFGKVYPDLAQELIEQIELSQEQFEMSHCKRKAKAVLKELEKVNS